MARHELALILLDVQMPEMDGFETAKMLRSVERTRYIPIIFVTAIDQNMKRINQGYQSGAVDFLFKPIDSHVLKSKVKVFLEQYQQKQQILQQSQELKESLAIQQTISDNLIAATSEAQEAKEEAERANRHLRELHQQITEELEQAQATQLAVLPQQMPTLPNVRMAAKYVPMAQLGGDFYNLYPFSEEQMGMVIADVTGHGVSAALISAMISSLFRTFAKKENPPAMTLQLVNGALYGRIPQEKYASAFYGIFNNKTDTLIYASAGHPAALVLRTQTSEVIELKEGGFLLGSLSNKMAKFAEERFQLIPNDKLILFTDGILEAVNEAGAMFGEDRLRQTLLQYQHLSIADLIETLYTQVRDYTKNKEVDDDITLVGLEILA